MNLLKHDEEGWGLLHIAVSARVHEERLACLGALLERSGKQKLNVNHRVNGVSRFQHAYTDKEFEYKLHTPLMFCARYGKVGSIRALMELKADVNDRDSDADGYGSSASGTSMVSAGPKHSSPSG